MKLDQDKMAVIQIENVLTGSTCQLLGGAPVDQQFASMARTLEQDDPARPVADCILTGRPGDDERIIVWRISSQWWATDEETLAFMAAERAADAEQSDEEGGDA